jgi:ornithine carbamoyltransferase
MATGRESVIKSAFKTVFVGDADSNFENSSVAGMVCVYIDFDYSGTICATSKEDAWQDVKEYPVVTVDVSKNSLEAYDKNHFVYRSDFDTAKQLRFALAEAKLAISKYFHSFLVEGVVDNDYDCS